jgi:hypothetical protein
MIHLLILSAAWGISVSTVICFGWLAGEAVVDIWRGRVSEWCFHAKQAIDRGLLTAWLLLGIYGAAMFFAFGLKHLE